LWLVNFTEKSRLTQHNLFLEKCFNNHAKKVDKTKIHLV